MLKFLTRTRGRTRLHWTDWLTYAYLCVGLFTMFAPILWLVMMGLVFAIVDFAEDGVLGNARRNG